MDQELFALLDAVGRREPASAASISQLEDYSGVQLPLDYLDLLRITDGFEGPIGEESYLVLWSASDVVERNERRRTSEFCPEIILIGSDGGGEGYAFDKRQLELPVIQIPLTPLLLEDAEEVGQTVTEFLLTLARTG